MKKQTADSDAWKNTLNSDAKASKSEKEKVVDQKTLIDLIFLFGGIVFEEKNEE